jgi:membrane-bound ClpP family serine protease
MRLDEFVWLKGAAMPEFLLDPNLLYIGLLVGLWMGVTAAYIPGIWIPETISFVLLIASLILLSFLPTNWVAVVVLLLGVSGFLLLPYVNKRYRQFAEVGLIGQALGSYFLFDGALRVSPLLIALTIILAVAYNRFVLMPILQRQHDYNEYDETNAIVGVRGRVVKELDPVGTVYVNKELWRARSAEYLPTDSKVIVTGRDGLELYVEKAKHEDAPAYEHESNGSSNGAARQ